MSAKMQSALDAACCAGGEISAYQEDVQITQEVKKTLVLVATDSLGKGDEMLGRHIVVNFILKMSEMGADLWRLVLLNGGVKLTVEGSEALPRLKELAQEGLGILVCGPCLKTFGLEGKNRVGEITNMLDIITSMQVADKVISLT